jgi:lysophospholipase L1-like esterase
MSSAPKDPVITWHHFMGDSITNSDATLFIPKTQQYPHRLQILIGGKNRARNFGVHGNTTTQMLARFAEMTKKAVPTVATIYGGINDVGQSVPDATTQSNLNSMIDQLRTAGCTRIILCNIHTMQNGASDTNYNAKRTVIQNVATSKGVVFCDFKTVTLIAADYNADGLHLSETGLQKLANRLKTTLDSQGWTDILKG